MYFAYRELGLWFHWKKTSFGLVAGEEAENGVDTKHSPFLRLSPERPADPTLRPSHGGFFSADRQCNHCAPPNRTSVSQVTCASACGAGRPDRSGPDPVKDCEPRCEPRSIHDALATTARSSR